MNFKEHTVKISGQDYLDLLEAKKFKEENISKLRDIPNLELESKHFNLIYKNVDIIKFDGSKEPKEIRIINNGTKPAIQFIYE